ncbi:hypothetical protein [Dankookia sp. P2]
MDAYLTKPISEAGLLQALAAAVSMRETACHGKLRPQVKAVPL